MMMMMRRRRRRRRRRQSWAGGIPTSPLRMSRLADRSHEEKANRSEQENEDLTEKKEKR